MRAIHLGYGRGAAVASLLLLLPVGTSAALPTDSTSYDVWYTGLRGADADPQRGANVQGLTLVRDRATLTFDSGTLHLLKAIEGRTYGAVFLGRGRMRMTAPIPAEQGQLRRFLESDTVGEAFSTAVLLFTDWTETELAEAVQFGPLAASRDARRAVEQALEYLSDDDGWASRDLMVPFLNWGAGFFYAHVAEDDDRPLMFAINPYDAEEVSLSRRAEGKGRRREVVTQFHKASDYENGTSLPQEALDLVSVGHYDIAGTIAKNLDFSARATATVHRRQDGHTWVPFTLHSELAMDSLVWSDGTHAEFARPKESSDLWVDISGAPSDPAELAFHYHGDILDRPRRLWVEPKTFTSWYPFHTYDRPATYRLSFTVPDEYQIGTVGTLVSEETDDDSVTRVWESGVVRQVTFNLGDFDTKEMDGGLGPRLTVQVSEGAHAEINDLAFRAGYLLGEQKDMAEAVGGDVSRAFAFFNQAFGPTQLEDFVATEIPYGHGQAFPGLILLSWSTFQKTNRKGYDEMFRAHEVAHQWWGIGVRPATYHDRWLAEGFSEFSGIWYMARVRGSADIYAERLKDSREEILRRREKAAPIWMGSRTATSDHPEDYQTVVYNKGAWVLHMLRMLVTDFDGGTEDVFEQIMKEFYTRYLGQPATTEQFRQVVEEKVGDMGWFFDQWVYNSAIPTYRFSHKVEEQPDGTWKATVRVRQEDVPDDFQMVVPIRLDFGAAGDAVVRVLAKGPDSQIELPPLPMKPEQVEFNAFEAVLAEVKTEGWRK